MATAIRNADASAVRTERFRTCRTSMSGSRTFSSCAIHRPTMTTLKANRARDRSDVHPQPPPSLKHDGHPDHGRTESGHSQPVEASRAAVRSVGKNDHHQDQRRSDGDRTEPECRPEVEKLSDQ